MKIYKMMFEIHNSQTGDVKTVDMSEWLGHYQFDDNWTIYKDYHVVVDKWNC